MRNFYRRHVSGIPLTVIVLLYMAVSVATVGIVCLLAWAMTDA